LSRLLIAEDNTAVREFVYSTSNNADQEVVTTEDGV
jgi:hypothetical protein